MHETHVTGIRITSAGHNDLEFWFGKESNLLTVVVTNELDDGDKNQEIFDYIRKYKLVSGVRVPEETLRYRIGSKEQIVEHMVSFEIGAKLDSKLFEEP